MPLPLDRRPGWSRPALGLVLSYVGFVSLGLPDTILGASWPAIRSDLRLPLPAAGSAVMVTMVVIPPVMMVLAAGVVVLEARRRRPAG